MFNTILSISNTNKDPINRFNTGTCLRLSQAEFPTPYVVDLLVGLRLDVVILLLGLKLEVVILLVGLRLEVVILFVGLRLEVVILLVGLRLEVVISFC